MNLYVEAVFGTFFMLVTISASRRPAVGGGAEGGVIGVGGGLPGGDGWAGGAGGAEGVVITSSALWMSLLLLTTFGTTMATEVAAPASRKT